MVDEGQLLMASPNPLVPDVEEELRLRLGMPVRTVLCTAVSVNAAVAEHFPRDAPPPAAVPSTPAAAKQEEPERKVAKKMDDEQLRRRISISLIAFGVVVMLFMTVRYMTYSGAIAEFPTFTYAIVAIFLGTIVGGAVFGLMMWKDL
jgi:hypothetical protein